MDIIYYKNYSDIYKCDKIICLSHFSRQDLTMLIYILEGVAKGKKCNLSNEHFIKRKDVGLELIQSDVDYGISQINKNKFVCRLSRITYLNAIDLIKNLLNNKMHGFQWLYDIDTSVEFLLSKDGRW